MAKDSSFDIVSDVNMQEMDNSVNQAMKEIEQRYDFKGSKAQIVLEKDSLKLNAEDDYKINAMLDILRGKMIKRGVSIKCLNPGKIENAFSGTLKQDVEIQKGLSKEKAKEVAAYIKELKLKVQAQIMDDKVRVSSAKKDDLQLVIQNLKSKDFGVDLQFINLR
ncbi:YajQ family cyclic di-GMP-binding protein [Clostridium aciditolerans]|uniref:Nucleotide-binding protein I6U51_15385 n=1 Tax=Clostridium aciditolerans TaxID=339861 RepID=A0A934I0V9_9CLOT|nr:YajQ family cyclic di-GMP-binding protein [Clostridium aciditolerans]MBI6874067.1 YajQ family cyclic di-GMP-binding protein [Clostridium aciditolerans]